jgi:hypothetical protein
MEGLLFLRGRGCGREIQPPAIARLPEEILQIGENLHLDVAGQLAGVTARDGPYIAVDFGGNTY